MKKRYRSWARACQCKEIQEMWSLQPRRPRRNSQRGDIVEETKIISDRSQGPELATALATGVTGDDMSDSGGVSGVEPGGNLEAAPLQHLSFTLKVPCGHSLLTARAKV